MNDNLFLFDDFITELNQDSSPGHLDQLELFYEDTDELFSTLTEIISSSQVAITYASANIGTLSALGKDEPNGYLLQWPGPEAGLTSIIHSTQAGSCNSFVAVFPFINDGIKYPCRVLEIRLFANRLEAQLVVQAGEDENLSLTFYDTGYLSDRIVYQKDAVYQFVLRGFAYHLETLSVKTDGMYALFPREELGADHYEIHGSVSAVENLPKVMLKQNVWLLRVTIARTEDDEPVDMAICLTAKVLGKNRLPEVGEEVNALIWLQGHLWGLASEE